MSGFDWHDPPWDFLEIIADLAAAHFNQIDQSEALPGPASPHLTGIFHNLYLYYFVFVAIGRIIPFQWINITFASEM